MSGCKPRVARSNVAADTPTARASARSSDRSGARLIGADGVDAGGVVEGCACADVTMSAAIVAKPNALLDHLRKFTSLNCYSRPRIGAQMFQQSCGRPAIHRDLPLALIGADLPARVRPDHAVDFIYPKSTIS